MVVCMEVLAEAIRVLGQLRPVLFGNCNRYFGSHTLRPGCRFCAEGEFRAGRNGIRPQVQSAFESGSDAHPSEDGAPVHRVARIRACRGVGPGAKCGDERKLGAGCPATRGTSSDHCPGGSHEVRMNPGSVLTISDKEIL